MKKIFALLMALCLMLSALPMALAEETNARREAIRQNFLKQADEVVITENAVIFTDSFHDEPIEIAKNPEKVSILYGSLATLWYEAGGKADNLVGGDSSVALYELYIGRDITKDEGVTVVTDSSAGRRWNTEAIIAEMPDLIICSTAMSGYKTIEGPAAAANIPVIPVDYNSFSDYLKWFKVFCNLTGNENLWEEVALPALDQVVDVICKTPENSGIKVFSVFSGARGSLTANTSNTVLGEMITQMGCINISDAQNNEGAERIEINLESVFAADPDVIVVQCHGTTEEDQAQIDEVFGGNAVWNALRPVKADEVHLLERYLFHYKPNSHFADAYKTLAQILYPDIDFGA